MPGEQFALPEAIDRLREVRRDPADHQLITLSAADPLNFTGLLTPGERIPALTTNRILYRDGVPVLAREAGQIKALAPDVEPTADFVHALIRKASTAALRQYLGMSGKPAASANLNRPVGQRRDRPPSTVHSEP